VIVTHNRRADLQRCVDAVRAQTRPPREVVVVDNGSQDSTARWLRAQPDVVSVRQQNLGSAGGFARGLAEARQMRSDAIWTLDDDCLPVPDCLEALLESPAFNRTPSVVGSLVISTSDRQRLAFPTPLHSSYVGLLDWYSRLTVRVADIANDADSRGHFWICLYNSALFRKRVIDRVGLPQINLFTWGDEVEYLLRIQAAGFPTYTVLDSVVHHPPLPATNAAPWKLAYGLRNKVLINRKYGRWATLKALVRSAQLIGWRRFDLIPPLWDGITGDLSRAYHDDPRWTTSA
jgi:rhamnopyranosyl-N-acetylglucosaminyl-diphospho-decaprenol beta-1,3/1,4-galactofuranosyltransferase